MPGGPSPPPEVIASWPKPNYINPETRGVGLVVVTWVLGGLTILTVSARLWSRVIVLRSPGKDDYVIIPATVRFSSLNPHVPRNPLIRLTLS